MPRVSGIRLVARTLASTVVIAATAVAAMAQAQPATCALTDLVPTVTTTGVASAEVLPNIATISLGVVTERPKAADAARENATAAQAVVAEIKGQGIDLKDIRTRSVGLTPVYDEIKDKDDRSSRRVLRGYLARIDLTVRIREIGKVGDLVARWIDKGANRVDSIEFDIENKEVRYDALRVDAVRDALRRAQSYTTGLGIRLGRVLSIAPPTHGFAPAAPPVALARAVPQQDGAVPIPVEPGVQTLRTEVQVTWELVQ